MNTPVILDSLEANTPVILDSLEANTPVILDSLEANTPGSLSDFKVEFEKALLYQLGAEVGLVDEQNKRSKISRYWPCLKIIL
jgi:hypothetical protein